MSIQNLVGICRGQKLGLSWELLSDIKTLSIQVATSGDFSTRERTFVIPARFPQIELDTGMGAWYFRVGAWLPDGRIEWSGIYGPVIVMTPKKIVPVPRPNISILRTEPIKGGHRIYTVGLKPYYAVIESFREVEKSSDAYQMNILLKQERPKFTAGSTKTQYEFDWGRGYVDCLGLSPNYIYNIRITTFDKDLGALPENDIRQLCDPIVLSLKTPLRHMKPHDHQDMAMSRAGDEILRDVKQNPNYRFKTYRDYTHYLEAKARQIN